MGACRPTSASPLGDFCWIDSTAARPCRHRTVNLTILPALRPGKEWSCYQLCSANEVSALRLRHLCPTPKPDPAALARLFPLLCKHLGLRAVQLRPWTQKQVLATKSGSLRRRYERGFQLNAQEGFRDGLAKVKMFIKHDKDPYDTLLDKSPRCIQYRSPRYNAAVSVYLMPIERWLFGGILKQRTPRTAVFAKFLTSYGKAERIIAMRKWADDTLYIELDHSRWDSHVVPELLEIEHRVYNTLLDSPELRHLLKLQIHNYGSSQNGVKYFSYGRRMSGDYNTGLGNSVLNYAILLWLTRNIPEAEIFLDGDDSVVAIPASKLPLFDQDFARVGMTTKVEQIQSCPYRVRFCQSSIVETYHGPKLVREPNRVISRTQFTTKEYLGTAWEGLVRSIGACEEACNRGVPMLQAYGQWMQRLFPSAKALQLEALPYDIRVRLLHNDDRGECPVTPEARHTFALAFAIPPEEQVRFEQLCMSGRMDDAGREFITGLRDHWGKQPTGLTFFHAKHPAWPIQE